MPEPLSQRDKSVFVLNAEYDYEGQATYGVYSTRELAEAAKAKLEADSKVYADRWYVYEVSVDAAPEHTSIAWWTDDA